MAPKPSSSRAPRIAATMWSIIPLGRRRPPPPSPGRRPSCRAAGGLVVATSWFLMTPQWPWLVYSQRQRSAMTTTFEVVSLIRSMACWTTPRGPRAPEPTSSFIWQAEEDHRRNPQLLQTLDLSRQALDAMPELPRHRLDPHRRIQPLVHEEGHDQIVRRDPRLGDHPREPRFTKPAHPSHHHQPPAQTALRRTLRQPSSPRSAAFLRTFVGSAKILLTMEWLMSIRTRSSISPGCGGRRACSSPSCTPGP